MTKSPTVGTKSKALKRMDNILIVVDDLEAAKAFFLELGLELESETTAYVRGPEGIILGLAEQLG